MHYSSNNLLTDNIMIEDSISIFGNSLEHYNTNEIDSTNTVNGKPVYFWKNKVGGKVPEGAGEVILANSKNVLVENQNLNNGTIGIEIAYSSNITVVNNTANSNNLDGIYLYSSSNNTISNNNANSNNWGDGIELWYSSNNKIYLNNFINNKDNFYSESSTNIWNSTEKITYTYKGNQYTNYLGNYWDDYTGSDADGDGIGDTPYSIDGDKDNYPLMEPYENYIGITENKPPIAKFTYLPETPSVNQEITFNASSSFDPDGSIVKYEWEFGDGTTKEGSYQVKLTVTDNDGGIGYATVTLTVSKKKKSIPTGKGMWIWHIWEIENGNVSKIIEKLNSTGINWVTIKIGDSDSYWLSEGESMYKWLKDNNYQDFSEVISQFHQAGIKVYGWHYVYSYDKYNIKEVSEADVSNKILDLKEIDGLIINAEKEYEDEDKNGDGIGDLFMFQEER